MQESAHLHTTDYNVLPERWRLTALERICEGKNAVKIGPFGSSLKKHELMDKGEIMTLWIENIVRNNLSLNYRKYISKEKYQELKNFAVEPDDVLITMMGTVGRVAVVPNDIGDAIISSYLLKITLNKNLCLPQFLYYYLQSDIAKRQFSRESRGIVMQGLNSKIIRALSIRLPPIEEQYQIISILSEVDELIQKTDQIMEQIQRLKKGLMQKLLTKGIRHTKFKEIILTPKYIRMSIPEGWEVVSFDDIAKRITYGFTNPMSHTNEGPWLITAKDVKEGKIDYLTAEKTSQKDYEELLTDKSRPKVGTVLITKDGTLGEVAIVDRNNICINQSIASIEPKNSILPEFLAMALQAPYMKNIIETFSPATTIRHISITDLAKWKFGLPTINEQGRIILILSRTDAYIQRTRNSKTLYEHLKKGLMQKLLTGKIRVRV